MPDISMCKGEGCERKETCYRYKAKPHQRQYYFKPDPKDCEHYWAVESKSQMRRFDAQTKASEEGGGSE